MDESPALYYLASMWAIAETGYDGYIGQKFIPKEDALARLEQAYSDDDV